MSRVAAVALLSVLSACSADWKGDGGGPDDDVDDGDAATLDGGAGDGGTGDGGAADGGAEQPDADGDGWTVGDGDCDDADPAIHPGAEETCDGIDNDCDGHSDADEDSDGDTIKDCEDFCPIQVDRAAAAGGDGSFANPFTSIQDGLDLAPVVGCWAVEVWPGTYEENLDFGGHGIDLFSVAGPADTTIDGGNAGSVVTFATGESADARIAGFTITHGAATDGAGIFVYQSDPTIQGNVITDNAVSGYPGTGGGIGITDGSPEIFDNKITDNDAGYGEEEDGYDGGAIKVRLGAPTIHDNVMTGNTAGDGGAMWFAYSDALVYQNLVADNAAYDTDVDEGGQGGGVNVQIATDDFVFTNNIVQDNQASTHGGGVAVYEDHPDYGEGTIANNLIAFNRVTATDQGAGLVVWSTCSPDVYNNIVYGNAGSGIYVASGQPWVAYNDVYGNGSAYGNIGSLTGTSGNIASDPRFTAVSDDDDWTNDDWTLIGSSPAVDAGWGSVTDPDGSRSDMGAYGGSFGSW